MKTCVVDTDERRMAHFLDGGSSGIDCDQAQFPSTTHGLDPHAYLKATLETIAGGHPASDIDQLLPWAFTPTPS